MTIRKSFTNKDVGKADILATYSMPDASDSTYLPKNMSMEIMYIGLSGSAA
jgi:hypothetical protein